MSHITDKIESMSTATYLIPHDIFSITFEKMTLSLQLIKSKDLNSIAPIHFIIAFNSREEEFVEP